MIARAERLLRGFRRNLSRSQWMSRLLRLPVSKGSPTRPGLLMIQIDGLARRELEAALRMGEMPFLQELIEREHYHTLSMYSGLPSSTPAVQAELFYGTQCAVPAFSFRDSETGKVVRMYEPETAENVERRLDRQCEEPLLLGGSAYSDNFTGGAREAHFCPSALGWGPAMRAANPLVLAVLLLSNLVSFLRIGLLLVAEVVIACVDFVRGVAHGRDFIKELKFVPTRVAICILLRELCVIGGKIDLARGLPIIHINLLGYDEQSHRRGPDSRFAHWTLQGIDDAVARLWRAAMASHWRHYDVWIYSDHGQCHAQSYWKQTGRMIDEAVDEAFESLQAGRPRRSRKVRASVETQRVRLLGGKRFQKLFPVNPGEEAGGENEPLVTALGPVGFVYSPWELNAGDRAFLAHELVHRHKVPVVIAETEDGRLLAWTSDGEFELPEEAAAVVGADHPFLEAIGPDLVELARHSCGGDLTLLAWRHGLVPGTFATENGSHAGATPEETEAFCLLPEDTWLPPRPTPWLRPAQLREAALAHLGRGESNTPQSAREPGLPTRRLRIMTYNVHSCLGMDGKLSAQRIARVIARYSPDIVALQELDVGRLRSGGDDQAEMIAHYLEMDFHFHPALHLEEERYGDAILTHLPLELVHAGPLPGLPGSPQREPRGALWARVDLHGAPVNIINTHLGLSPRERLAQTEALLGEEWLGHPDCRGPVILCGDFNAVPSSKVCRLLRERLDDAQVQLRQHRPRGTFYSRLPTARIDHVFVDRSIEVSAVQVPRSSLTLVASDHLPLVIDVLIPDNGAPPDAAEG